MAGQWQTADYQNDGRLDLPLLSRAEGALLPDVLCHSPQAFTNLLQPLSTWSGFAASADFDNDGLLDLFQGGYGEKRTPNPPWQDWIDWRQLTRQLWRNTGSGFAAVNNPFPLLHQGSADWGDYDNDGRLDILLAGATDLRHREQDTNGEQIYFYEPHAQLATFEEFPNPRDAGYPGRLVTEVWRNTGSGFTNIHAGLPGVWTGTAAWGDYDNDGRKDILLAGGTNVLTAMYDNEYYSNVTNVQGWPTGFVAQVWRNTSHGFININAGLPGIGYGSAAWGDADNDGRLDVALTGTCWVHSCPMSLAIIT